MIPSVTPEFLSLVLSKCESDPVPYPMLEEEAIRLSAYFAWEEAGRPDNMSDHFWHEAEKHYRNVIWL